MLQASFLESKENTLFNALWHLPFFPLFLNCISVNTHNDKRKEADFFT